MVNEMDYKRYNTLDSYLKRRFSSKVAKISLNAGFSCPNIKNNHGCIFCSNGSSDFGGNKNDDLITQFYSVKNVIDKKWKNLKYIAYFQANTNTYADVFVLKEKYESVLKIKDVVGLSVATRSDAINDDTLLYLKDLNKRTFLTVELGLQSIKSETLKLINRGHDLANFTEMVKKLKENNIFTVVHIINGLPNETKEDMLNTVRYLNKLKIDGIKIHMLCVLKDTPLEKYYNLHNFHILTKEEYIDIVCSQLELLNKDIVIERLTADPNPDKLIAPTWTLKKFCVLNDIDKEMKKRDSYQGKYQEE